MPLAVECGLPLSILQWTNANSRQRFLLPLHRTPPLSLPTLIASTFPRLIAFNSGTANGGPATFLGSYRYGFPRSCFLHGSNSLPLQRLSSLFPVSFRPSGLASAAISRSWSQFCPANRTWPSHQSSLFPSLSFTYLLTLLPYERNPGWTSLPLPRGSNGIKPKLSCCAGCHLPLSPSKHVLTCALGPRGFTLPAGTPMLPCLTSYHTGCIKVCPPFTSRLTGNKGLVFPKVSHWGTFICELCTVRSVLGRELHQPTDTELLMLERMQLIVMANAWALGTHDQYQLRLSVIRSFEQKHRFQFLGPQPPAFPPNTIDIPLMWTQISYSLRPSTRQGETAPSFQWLRSGISAVLPVNSWDGK
jgi:hypothetical protein